VAEIERQHADGPGVLVGVREGGKLMAAALIPLIAGLAPEIINLIVGLVHPKAIAAEQNNGPLSGPVKFADVFVGVMKDLTAAHVAGTIALLPDDATVKVIIQAVVTSMQLTGLIGGASPAATPSALSAQSVVLKNGQSVLVTA
jgi:hypothetical protein